LQEKGEKEERKVLFTEDREFDEFFFSDKKKKQSKQSREENSDREEI